MVALWADNFLKIVDIFRNLWILSSRNARETAVGEKIFESVQRTRDLHDTTDAKSSCAGKCRIFMAIRTYLRATNYSSQFESGTYIDLVGYARQPETRQSIAHHPGVTHRPRLSYHIRRRRAEVRTLHHTCTVGPRMCQCVVTRAPSAILARTDFMRVSP